MMQGTVHDIAGKTVCLETVRALRLVGWSGVDVERSIGRFVCVESGQMARLPDPEGVTYVNAHRIASTSTMRDSRARRLKDNDYNNTISNTSFLYGSNISSHL
jgi:hypothetical protein